MRNDIVIAGDILVDTVKLIDRYPEKNMLVRIGGNTKAVGGCVPNTAINLAKMDPSLKIQAMGRIGSDDNGRFVLSEMKDHGIDVSRVIVSENEETSYDDVMTEQDTGARTFFFSIGPNRKFCIEDIDVNQLDCDIFHIGYILLLDALDADDAVYGTRMARLLKRISDKDIKTSIDVVSEDSDRFREKIIPVLPYCSFTIMNEIECCKVSGLNPRNDDGTINTEHIKETMKLFLKYGVREKVIVHCCEAGFMMDVDGTFTCVPSLLLPSDYIKGSVGAGDAFAAACLYGLKNQYSDQKILEFASAAAACNLSKEDSVSGMKHWRDIKKIAEQYPRRN